MKSKMGWRLWVGFWSMLVCVGMAQAQTGVSVSQTNSPAPVVGEVVFARGVGFAQMPGQTPRTLGVGLNLQQGDRLTTAVGASAIVKLADGTRMTLRPQSDMVLQQVRYTPDAPDNNLLLELLRGGFRAITGLIAKDNDRAALVKTPTATIGIRGTDFDARLCGTDCFEEIRTAKEAPRAASLRASAKVVLVDGVLTATSDAGDQRKLVHGGSIYPGDVLETGPRTKVVLAFRDESKITLGAATTFKVNDFVFDSQNPSDGRFLVSLLKGTVRALTGLIGKAQPRNVAFKTPTATIGIRGTGIDLSCESAGCQFFTWLGTMTVTPEGQTALQVLQAGQGLFVSPTGMSPINELPLPGLDRPDQVPVDVGPLFSSSAVDDTAQGLYVFVRDGHIQITTATGDVMHLGRGEVGLADNEGRALRPLQVPLFMDLDPTPQPNNSNPLLTTVLEEAGVRTQNQCRR
ncbi:MAG: FecR domain-containing protein [Hydrogenophaga sp.]|uniref:FecR family protein n=1 Tax=Hydrogenophaga sp. TaxID=1904254 RepID=UPI002ABC22D5|nr:FecR domain-containing protein [Hydrogenophaga sp.]MDZ4188459.1 FecR domain-containing protein [Hydrogenophaga sp.]